MQLTIETSTAYSLLSFAMPLGISILLHDDGRISHPSLLAPPYFSLQENTRSHGKKRKTTLPPRHHEPILGSSGVETNRSYDRPSLSQKPKTSKRGAYLKQRALLMSGRRSAAVRRI
jgi:hypothetical protein